MTQRAGTGRTIRVMQLCTTTLGTAYFGNIARGLHARGIEVHGASLRDPSAPAWTSELGSTYTCLHAPSRSQLGGAILRLAHVLRRERIDVLHSHLFDAGFAAVLAGRLARTPLIALMRHHLDDNAISGTRAHVELDKWMARRADYVIVPGDAVRRHMIEQEGLRDVDIETIHLGFDFEALGGGLDARARIRSELGLSDAFVIGAVGRVVRNKGLAYLFEAAAAMRATIPELRVLVVGTGDIDEHRAIARRRGIEDIVVFAGFRRDVGAVMSAMDVLVHASLSEAFCQVIIEAMGVGTAVVVTDVGGAREVVTHSENGWIVRPRDPGAIAREVIRMYRDPTVRKRTADAGRESVRARFTVDRMVDAQVRSYERHLATARRGALRRAVPSQHRSA